ncbi:tripartite tricarboxylate transporter substrate binding protein [Rhizobium sp. BK251]|uniref:Bug family tripartite tricarboxylate transporter substrate binding protein n=1 Tax=Rhizobium sp. BK251 TaxID=2512125 RepID=UPI0010E78DA2|nr:tripartite tricarboxylate transporter substrate binding protein [Rhizobium sp. BK251]TCL70158.1 tripartite-type tricarboxylate transporter receptor subunit TctC [Rhizobium sp. BK251]
MRNPVARALTAVAACCRSLACLLPLLLLSGVAMAQGDYPSHPVRIVIGAGAGTPPDVALRAISHELSTLWGQPVVIENLVGAGGNIAGDHVAKAEPDGYTLLFGANSGIVMNQSLYRNMTFDPVRDLAPISIVCSYPTVLVVHKNVPANSVEELVALARERPGKLTFASAGPGTSSHLAAAMLDSMAGIELVHVPYAGGVNLVTDLFAGRIDVYFGLPSNMLPAARAGEVKALAVTSRSRFAFAPQLPTMDESGFPGFEMVVWWGLLAPSGTPPAVIQRLHRDVVKVVQLPEMRKRLADLSMEAIGNSPEEFSAVIEADVPKWQAVIREAGVTLE